MAILGFVQDAYLKRRIPRKEFIIIQSFPYQLPIKFSNTPLPPLPPVDFPFTLPLDFENL